MPETQSESLLYNGWHIEIVQRGDRFFFQCYPPELLDFCNDAVAYGSYREAFIAACHFVDRETAILALISQANVWLENCRISEAEYWNLTTFA